MVELLHGWALGLAKASQHECGVGNRLSYDFVVCSKDATVLGAIELDDKTHESASRAETDAKKEKATHAAGIRLIRWHAKSLPDEQAIRAAFPPKSLASDGNPNSVDGRFSSP